VLDFDFTNQFKKDLRQPKKRGKDLGKIYDIIASLVFEKTLPVQCREHKLHGDLKGYTECHIEGDWITTYKKTGNKIIFAFTGTHSDYF